MVLIAIGNHVVEDATGFYGFGINGTLVSNWTRRNVSRLGETQNFVLTWRNVSRVKLKIVYRPGEMSLGWVKLKKFSRLGEMSLGWVKLKNCL